MAAPHSETTPRTVREPAAPPVGFFPRLGDPMSWTSVDRCFVMSCLFIMASVPFVVFVTLGRTDEDMQKVHDPIVALAFGRAAVAVDVAWLALATIAVAIRRRTRRSAALEHVTVQLIAATLSVACWVMGLFTTPFALALLGALVVGFLLFRRSTVLFAATTATLLLLGASLATHLGVLPYAPLYRGVPMHEGHIAGWWHLEMLLLVLVDIVVVLGIFLFVLGRLRDREANLERLSRTDPLTGATNRRELMTTFDRELARADRKREPIAVVMCDLDHFKAINDKHGHLAGDAVLVAAAERLAKELRAADALARYGGEEFVLLLPSTDAEGARVVAERCRRRLAESPIEAEGVEIAVTASFGVAARDAGASRSAEELLRDADEALYRAKRAGRDRVEAA